MKTPFLANAALNAPFASAAEAGTRASPLGLPSGLAITSRTLTENAGSIPYAPVLSGEIEPGDDVDHFLIPAVPGAVVTAAVYDLEGGEGDDSVLRLLDRDGEVLAEDDDAGPGFLSRIVHSVDRPGTLVLTIDGFDDTPDDGAPHAQAFRYWLVVAVEDEIGGW